MDRVPLALQLAETGLGPPLAKNSTRTSPNQAVHRCATQRRLLRTFLSVSAILSCRNYYPLWPIGLEYSTLQHFYFHVAYGSCF